MALTAVAPGRSLPRPRALVRALAHPSVAPLAVLTLVLAQHAYLVLLLAATYAQRPLRDVLTAAPVRFIATLAPHHLPAAYGNGFAALVIVETLALVALYHGLAAPTAGKVAVVCCGALLAYADAAASPAATSADMYAYVGFTLLGVHAYAPPATAFPGAYATINAWWHTPLIASPYGPLWLGVSGLVAALAHTLPAKIAALRLLGAVTLAATAAVLAALKVPARVVALVALNPALIFEFVANVHNDLFGVLFLLLARYAALRGATPLAIACAAGAGLVKVPFMLFAALALVPLASPVRRVRAYAATLALALGGSWLAGGPAYYAALLRHAEDSTGGAVALAFSGLSAVLKAATLAAVAAALLGGPFVEGCSWALPAVGALLHPWYVSWALPYAVARTDALRNVALALPFVTLLADGALADGELLALLTGLAYAALALGLALALARRVVRPPSAALAERDDSQAGNAPKAPNCVPMSERGFLVTTPIYYISGNPHIGHAYTTVAADVLGRYHRTLGPTFMLTGTDEHGQKVAAAAAAAGVTPQAWTDSLVPRWQALLDAYDVRYDDFIRTTERRHTAQVVEVFERLKHSGDVYLGKYEGWYCTNDETFWLESKLVDGRCPNAECRREVQWLSEDNWFFALSKYQDRLVAYYREHPQWVRPERAYNEMVATLEGGLEDLCISRLNLEWGVPLPGGGVMYVWLDALLNYITALDYAADGERFRTFWPANVQLIGKEIARFHTLIWPAVLWALGLPAPDLVFAHGWMTFDGEKMSKSRGNVVDPFDVVERFGADTVRYFLLREAPFGSDFSFSEEKVRVRRNGDLGNDLGNLVKRSLAMLARYRGGIVPSAPASAFGERFAGLGARVGRQLEAVAFREALESVWELVTALNREIDERKPWELHKRGEGELLDAVLYDLCEGLRFLAHLCAPFVPATAGNIWAQLGFTGEPSGAWSTELVWGRLPAGTHTLPADAPLFPRLDKPAA